MDVRGLCNCMPWIDMFIKDSAEKAPENIFLGSHVWVECSTETWTDGCVSNIDRNQIHVQTSNGNTVIVDSSKVYPKGPEDSATTVEEFLLLRNATIHLQTLWRGRLARKLYKHVKEKEAGAIRLQSAVRGMVARNRFKSSKKARAASVIQAQWHGRKEHLSYIKFRAAAIVVQCAWRRRLARKKLARLKIAAKEIRSLQKNVRLLMAKLQSEKNLRDSDAKDIAKLREVLLETQLEMEANPMFNKVKIEALKAIETTPVHTEETTVSFRNTQNTDTLRAEIKSLEESIVQAMTCATSALQAYAQSQDHNEKMVKKLEHKLSSLDSENHLLRLQSLSSSSSRSDFSQVFRTSTSQEHHDLLLRCISEEIGFSNGRPVAACIVYKCLLHWGSFESEKASIFEEIIQTIGFAIEAPENTGSLAYWLSNTSTLLLLLQPTLKVGEGPNTPRARRKTSSSSLFGKLSQGLSFKARNVEPKSSTLLFNKELTATLERIYVAIRENLKKEMEPLLELCIQPRKTSQASRTQVVHWQRVVKILDTYLETMKSNFVPTLVIRKMFMQAFSFINVQLFNSLLSQRECCSLSNGERAKIGLSELEAWCSNSKEVYVGAAWEQLKHIRQAIALLVSLKKSTKTLKELTSNLCPVLSIHQLHKICTMYWDENDASNTFSSEVLSTLKRMSGEDATMNGNSFTLEYDTSIPFSVDDISKTETVALADISNVKPPSLLEQNPGFSFLTSR